MGSDVNKEAAGGRPVLGGAYPSLLGADPAGGDTSGTTGIPSDPRKFRHRSTGLGVGSTGLGARTTGLGDGSAGLAVGSTGSRVRSAGLGVGSTGPRLRSAGLASSQHGVASRQRGVAFLPHLGGYRPGTWVTDPSGNMGNTHEHRRQRPGTWSTCPAAWSPPSANMVHTVQGHRGPKRRHG
jgi:hypothetical protein